MKNIAKALWEIKNQEIGMKIGIAYFAICLALSVLFESIPMQLQVGMLLTIGGMLILKLRRLW
jgi:hypothetical protein